MLCVLDFLAVHKQRKLCIFALLAEFTCVTEEGESQNQHASQSGTLVHISILLQKNTAMTPAPRTSPRRKKATGSVVTKDGKRRFTRGKK